MAVKPGYKQTEVGVIPEEWEVKFLREVAQIRSGIAKNANIAVTNPIRVHYLRVANVQDGFLDLSEMNQIEISRGDLQRYAVLPGDVLMNEGGDLDKLGRGAIWQGEFNPCVHQNHVFVVRCGSTVDSTYINIWSAGSVARRYFLVAGKQTTNLASINKTALGELPVAVPPLPEQQAIAEALRDVDGLISALDALITKKRALKQGAMQELLTGQRRLPGFAGDWEVKTLGACLLTNPEYGINAPAVPYSDNLPVYVRITDITGDGTFSPDKIASVENVNSDKYLLELNDVVFARTGASTGKTYLYNPKDGVMAFAGFLIRVKTDPSKLLAHYLAYYTQTQTYWNWVTVMSMRSGQPGINGNEYSQLPILLPALAEQTAIAQILTDMDAELAALAQKRAKTVALKQGMMQELLTGAVRLGR